MIDDKTKNSIITKFETAAKEFNFNFVTPYCIGENNELRFFGYLFKENAEKGVIIDIIGDFEDIDIKKRKHCQDNNLFYSLLFITPLLEEYKSSYFSEMLKDWRYEFWIIAQIPICRVEEYGW